MISRLWATKLRRISRRTATPVGRDTVTSAPLLKKEIQFIVLEVSYDDSQRGGLIRREVTAFACQDRDIDIIAGGNLAHEA